MLDFSSFLLFINSFGISFVIFIISYAGFIAFCIILLLFLLYNDLVVLLVIVNEVKLIYFIGRLCFSHLFRLTGTIVKRFYVRLD